MSSDQMTHVQPQADRVYEDFDPTFDWDHDEGSNTLIVMLPGFKREQLRVQIASNRILRLSGERQIHENKWSRFRKEVPIPPESDTSEITAKFEAGILYVRIPKVITPIKPQPPPTTTPTQQEPPKPPQQPTAEAPPIAQPAHHADQQKPRMDKAEEAKTEKTTEAPPPTPIAPLQEPKATEDSQKKPGVDKGGEAKAEKTEAPAAPTPVGLRQKPKPVYKEKGEAETDADKVAKKRGKATTTSRGQELHKTTRPNGLGEGEAKMEKRSPTLELLSRQTQEYKNALSGWVEELKKQKKLANLLVVIFVILVFGIYVKNAVKSSFGGPKNQEL